jgi:hypothetical protein
MDAKLTLNVDRNISARAKAYARSRGRSLSDLVEDYLKFLTSSRKDMDPELTPRVKSLFGSIKVPEELDYKKELNTQLRKKYLKE